MNQRVVKLYEALQVAGDEITSLRDRVGKGEVSLGSRFDNFVFCNVGANPVDWMPFYELDEQMRSSEGEELLIVCSKREPSGPEIRYASGDSNPLNQIGFVMPLPGRIGPEPGQMSFLPPPVFYDVDYNMAYGILTGKGLDFDLDAGEIIFPSGHYRLDISAKSIFNSNLHDRTVEKKRGRIRKNVADLTHLYKSYSLESLRHWAGNNDSQILVGSEVEKYFETIGRGDEVYAEIRKRL